MTMTNNTNEETLLLSVTSPTDACQEISIYANIGKETKSVYTTIACVMATLMIVINCLTLFVIYKKKLYLVQSNQLVFLMTVMDIVDAIANGYVKVFVLWKSSEVACETWTVLLFFLTFSYNSPIYIITLISFDRFVHVRYPSKYALIITSYRFKCGMVASFVLNSIQSFLFIFLTSLYSMSTAKLIMTVWNVAVLLINGILYLVSRHILAKIDSEGSFVYTSRNRNISKMATWYLVLLMVLKLSPMVLYLILHSYATSHQQEMALTLYLDRFLDCYGIVNSFVFLGMNRKAKQYLKEFRLCTNQVDASE